MKHFVVTTLLVCFCGACSIVRAEVPPDLINAVEYQKKNKDALINGLQERVTLFERQKDAKGAKEMKKQIQAVRANKALVLPSMGEAGDLPGTMLVEKIIRQEKGGCRIQTSLPQLEGRSGVNARTGAQVASPQMGQEFIYYPENVFVATSRELKEGERINVRRTDSGYSEIPQEELDEAAALLKRK